MDILSYMIGKKSDSGSADLTYETGTFIPTEDISTPQIYFKNHHDTTPIYFTISCIDDENTTLNIMKFCTYADAYKITGAPIRSGSSSDYKYSLISFGYMQSNASWGMTGTQMQTITSSDDSRTRNYNDTRYWVNEEWFKPCAGYWATDHPFGANKTYKWIAIWK